MSSNELGNICEKSFPMKVLLSKNTFFLIVIEARNAGIRVIVFHYFAFMHTSALVFIYLYLANKLYSKF